MSGAKQNILYIIMYYIGMPGEGGGEVGVSGVGRTLGGVSGAKPNILYNILNRHAGRRWSGCVRSGWSPRRSERSC